MAQAGPRRRPEAGGYARGDEKRVRIIESALRIFGQQGYERASTRQIAQHAGVNPPALQYYFTSKQGLHLACAEHIGALMGAALASHFAAADAVAQDAAPEAAIAALCDLLDGLADFLFGSPLIEDWLRFLARSQGEDDGPSVILIRQRFAADLQRQTTRLVAIALRTTEDDPHTKLRSLSITGQLTALHLGRNNTLAHMQWTDFNGDHLALIKATVREHTQAVLRRGWGGAEEGQGGGSAPRPRWGQGTPDPTTFRPEARTTAATRTER